MNKPKERKDELLGIGDRPGGGRIELLKLPASSRRQSEDNQKGGGEEAEWAARLPRSALLPGGWRGRAASQQMERAASLHRVGGPISGSIVLDSGGCGRWALESSGRGGCRGVANGLRPEWAGEDRRSNPSRHACSSARRDRRVRS